MTWYRLICETCGRLFYRELHEECPLCQELDKPRSSLAAEPWRLWLLGAIMVGAMWMTKGCL